MANIYKYNRESTNKVDIFTSSNTQKTQLNSTTKLKYSALYPDYRQQSTRKPIPIITRKNHINNKSSESLASKSDEVAIKKYRKWSKKLLLSCQLSTEAAAFTVDDTHPSLTPSGYFSQQEDDIAAVIVTAKRKSKVSDCMRNFLRKKLFLQLSKEYENSTVNRGLANDYNEADMLESSYNADEEDDTDSKYSCDGRINDNEHCGCLKAKHLCYSFRSDENVSDIGISDCCQLLSDNCTKRRNLKRGKRFQKDTQRKRYTTQSMEPLQATWYQPHLSTNAANERLRDGTPGDFILRRGTRNYELSLRLKTKVKHFVILDCGNGYKFKDGKKQFATLQILITHHSVMAEQLPMTLALARPEILNSDTRRSDDFDSFESLQFLNIVKCMQAKCLEFV